jgi:hypothetical protein
MATASVLGDSIRRETGQSGDQGGEQTVVVGPRKGRDRGGKRHESVETTGPTSGRTVVTIAGSAFVKDSRVDFGSVPALKVTFLSPTTLRAVAPAGSGTVDITVTTPSGSSQGDTTYAYDPRPTVTSVTPSSGSVTGGTPITVYGTGFVSGASNVEVGQGGHVGPVSVEDVDVVSSTEIQFVTDPAVVAGRFAVWVVTPGGKNLRVPGDFFVYASS